MSWISALWKVTKVAGKYILADLAIDYAAGRLQGPISADPKLMQAIHQPRTPGAGFDGSLIDTYSILLLPVDAVRAALLRLYHSQCGGDLYVSQISELMNHMGGMTNANGQPLSPQEVLQMLHGTSQAATVPCGDWSQPEYQSGQKPILLHNEVERVVCCGVQQMRKHLSDQKGEKVRRLLDELDRQSVARWKDLVFSAGEPADIREYQIIHWFF